MNLKHFSWACLLLGVLAVVYPLAFGPVQAWNAASLFSTTMILMAVGFALVGRELARLRSNSSAPGASTGS